MLIGITIDKFKEINPSILIKLIRSVGLNFIEITASIFDDLQPVLSELGIIKTGFHLPNFHDNKYDFSHIKYKDEIDRLTDLINKHHTQLNVHYCLAHPPEGHESDIEFEKASTFLFNNLMRINSSIIIENPLHMKSEQFKIFYNKAKNELGEKLVGQCYDPAHYFVSGENPVSILKQINSDEILTIHLSDCKPDRDAHLPFGLDGVLPITDILNILKKTNYKNAINLELLPRSFSEIDKVINSYLLVLKKFQKTKYLLLKLKLLFILPLLKQSIKKAAKKFESADSN